VSLLSRSSISVLAAMFTVFVALAGVVWLSTVDAGSASANSHLMVGSTRYDFGSSVCTLTETDFVAAGRGTTDGQPFWVSASSRGISLTVGPDSEVARPADDQLWLTSTGGIAWSQSDGVLQVTAAVVDGRQDNSDRRSATLFVNCNRAT